MSLSASDVSIVTVNWNGRMHLETLLPSLQNQEAGEIIVVDNGSTDDSVSFLREHHPFVRILRNPVNKGFSQPNNLAAREAKGKILALINNDMKAHPDWIRNGLRSLENCDCVASRILSWDGTRIDFNGSSLQYLGYALQKESGRLLSSVTGEGGEVLFPCGGAMLIPRDLFLESGGFDEDFFAIFEDVDLGWRLRLSGRKIVLAPESTVFHKGHATFRTQDNSRMRYLMHRNALLAVLKNYDDENVRKIFPMAMLMAVRRAVRCSGVEKESFYLWGNTRRALASGDPRKLSSSLDALNHLVALDDVIRMIPGILEKRRVIQAGRKVGDTAILSLFDDPLRAIVEDGEYAETEAGLLEAIGLGDLFDTRSYREKAALFPSPSDSAVSRCRDELKALQWLGGQALMHPPEASASPESRLRRFVGAARSRGVGPALKLAWRAVTKGRKQGG